MRQADRGCWTSPHSPPGNTGSGRVALARNAESALRGAGCNLAHCPIPGFVCDPAPGPARGPPAMDAHTTHIPQVRHVP